jgi:hypothetical protein
MQSLRKLLHVLLVCGMIPLTAWSSFPRFACACSTSAEKPACTCGHNDGGAESSCCQKACCCSAGKAGKRSASVRKRHDHVPAVALLAKGVPLPGAHVCQCTSAPTQQPADSVARHAEKELSVLYLALPDVMPVREADRHVAVRFSGVTLPRLDRVIFFCALLI